MHNNNSNLSYKSSSKYNNSSSSLSSKRNSNSHKMLDSPALFHLLLFNNKVFPPAILVTTLMAHSLQHPPQFLNSSSLKNSCYPLSSLKLIHNKNRNHLHQKITIMAIQSSKTARATIILSRLLVDLLHLSRRNNKLQFRLVHDPPLLLRTDRDNNRPELVVVRSQGRSHLHD